MMSDEVLAYNVHTISSATTLMSASSSWTLSYHLVLFPRSQHFTVTSASMLSAVRHARLYVNTTRPAENTHSLTRSHTTQTEHWLHILPGVLLQWGQGQDMQCSPYEPTNVAQGLPHPSRFHSYKHLIALRVSILIERVHLSSCTLVSTNLA